MTFVISCFPSAGSLQDHPGRSVCQFLHSFLWPRNIPSYGNSTFYSRIHQLMDIWVVPTVCLLQIIQNTHVSSFQEVELLGHMVALHLIVWGAARLFPTAAAPFHLLSEVQENWIYASLTPQDTTKLFPRSLWQPKVSPADRAEYESVTFSPGSGITRRERLMTTWVCSGHSPSWSLDFPDDQDRTMGKHQHSVVLTDWKCYFIGLNLMVRSSFLLWNEWII